MKKRIERRAEVERSWSRWFLGLGLAIAARHMQNLEIHRFADSFELFAHMAW